MPIITEKDKRALMLGGIGLAVLLFVGYEVLPTVNHWRSVRDQVTLTQTRLTDYEADLRKLQSRNKQLSKIYGQSVYKPLETVDDAKVSYLASLETIVRNAGIQKPTIKAQPDRPLPGDKNMMLVGMRIQGKCRFPQLMDCLAKISELEHLVVVEQVQMTKTPKNNNLDVSFIASRIARVDKDAK